MNDDDEGSPRDARRRAHDEGARAPELEARVPRGWYPDPWSQARYRWWDGRRWCPEITDVEPEGDAAAGTLRGHGAVDFGDRAN